MSLLIINITVLVSLENKVQWYVFVLNAKLLYDSLCVCLYINHENCSIIDVYFLILNVDILARF